MVKEIHRAEMISQVTLREEEEKAQGRSQSRTFQAGTLEGPCSPLCGATKLVKGDAQMQAWSSVPAIGLTFIPCLSSSGNELVRDAFRLQEVKNLTCSHFGKKDCSFLL